MGNMGEHIMMEYATVLEWNNHYMWLIKMGLQETAAIIWSQQWM